MVRRRAASLASWRTAAIAFVFCVGGISAASDIPSTSGARWTTVVDRGPCGAGERVCLSAGFLDPPTVIVHVSDSRPLTDKDVAAVVIRAQAIESAGAATTEELLSAFEDATARAMTRPIR